MEFLRQHYMRYRLKRHVSNPVALGGDYLRATQTDEQKESYDGQHEHVLSS